MMAWLLGFLFGNWMLWLPAIAFLAVAIFFKDVKLIIFAVIALLAVGYVGTLRGDVAAAVKRADDAEAAELIWKTSSEKQNLAVEGWKAAAIQNAAALKRSEQRASAKAAAIPAATEKTMNTVIPSKSGEPTCEESMQWLATPERVQSFAW
jgi:hypothetical protein